MSDDDWFPDDETDEQLDARLAGLRPYTNADRAAQIRLCQTIGMTRQEYVTMHVDWICRRVEWQQDPERDEILAAIREDLERAWDREQAA